VAFIAAATVRRTNLVVILALAVTVAGPGAASANPEGGACGIPCGPVPVIIMIHVEPEPRDADLSESAPSRFEGYVEYHVPIDEDAEGFFFSPTDRPVIRFEAARAAAWVSMKVEPPEIEVPVDDPRYLGPDGYRYRHAITVTATATERPSPEDLRDQIRPDGRYRVLLTATSDPSTVDPGAMVAVGLMEGYGVREFRFLPAAHWEVAPPAAHADGASPSQRTQIQGVSSGAPGPAIAVAFLLAALSASFVAAVHRRNPR
jgi:hypothetical protein